MARQRKTPKKILQAITEEMKAIVNETIEVPPITIECACGWTKQVKIVAKGSSIQCPKCKTWIKVRLNPNKEHYVRGLGVTPSGNDTLDVNDDTATLLRGLPLEELYDVVSSHLEECGMESMSKGFIKGYGKKTPWDYDTIHAYLTDRYWSRNAGMQRMNLGNVLRAAMQRRSILNAKSN